MCYKTTRQPKRGESVLNIHYFSLFENLNISRDGVDLKWRPTLALIRLKVRNMEGASSANKSCSRQMFDSVFGADELESGSQLGPSMSDQQHVSKECTDPIRKRRELGPRGRAFRFSGEWSVSSNDFYSGACRAQAFQEHVERRLVGSNPFSSVTYITFLFRRGDVFACNSTLNGGSVKNTVSILGYIQSSMQIQLRVIHQKWMNGELSWKVMLGGLCGSEEFTREIIDPLPGWTRVVALGKLRLNNAGKLQVFV